VTRKLMLRRGLKITAIGLTAGVLGAIASTRLVSGMLFQVQPHVLRPPRAHSGGLSECLNPSQPFAN